MNFSVRWKGNNNVQIINSFYRLPFRVNPLDDLFTEYIFLQDQGEDIADVYDNLESNTSEHDDEEFVDEDDDMVDSEDEEVEAMIEEQFQDLQIQSDLARLDELNILEELLTYGSQTQEWEPVLAILPRQGIRLPISNRRFGSVPGMAAELISDGDQMEGLRKRLWKRRQNDTPMKNVFRS